MSEKGLPAPTPKLKKKFPVTGQTTKKGNNLNPKVVIKPIDQNQGQNALNLPNQPVNLPDQPQNIPNPPPPPPIPQHLMNQQNLPIQQNQPDQQNIPNQQNQQDQQQDQQNLPNLPNQQNQPNILDLPNPLVLPKNPPNPPNPPNPSNQPNPPNQPNQANQPNPMDQPNPPQPQLMNWSYFKPEFSGKAEEDTTMHLLKTNDWMDTYNFPKDIKVRRFCLTLTGEARLWYESLKPIDMDWNALQTHFRQQYSKFGSSREQYFHVWR